MLEMYSISPKIKHYSFWFLALLLISVLTLLLAFYIWTKSLTDSSSSLPYIAELNPESTLSTSTLVFPVGVRPSKKEIIESPVIDTYVNSYLSYYPNNKKRNVFDKFMATLVQYDWYQNLASAVSRILIIYPGERKEEVANNFAKILKWSEAEKEDFLNLVISEQPELEEGKFFPGKYVVPVDASPLLVAEEVNKRFDSSLLDKYTKEVEAVVPLDDALIIASLLEREAYDFTDMRIISGIIWNRLFTDMPLQLDATLQYVRGGEADELLWWPTPVPADKFLESPYNTYQNEGLPPSPIANPSVAAVIAALNPKATTCLFYFHGPKGQFYCTETYEEHVAKLKEIYGQGK